MKKLLKIVLATGVVLAIGVSMLSVSATELAAELPSGSTVETTDVAGTVDRVETSENTMITDEVDPTGDAAGTNVDTDATEDAGCTDKTDGTEDSAITEDSDATEDELVSEDAEDAVEESEIVIEDELVPLSKLPEQAQEEATITVRQVLVYAGKEYVEQEVFSGLVVGDTVDTASYIRDDDRVSYTSGAEVVEVSGDLTVSLYYEMS